MKKLIYIALFLVSSLSISQETPLENLYDYNSLDGSKNGRYFIDNNNLLDGYTGVWQWTDGDKELTFYLYKDVQVPVQYPQTGEAVIYYEIDLIYGYYIYKENGNELINTKPDLLSQIDDRDWLDRGGVGMTPRSSGYDVETAPDFLFTDYSRRICIDGNEIPIKGDSGYWRFDNPTTARVGLFTGGAIYTNCPTQILYPNFPANEGITLTRIATEAPPL